MSAESYRRGFVKHAEAIGRDAYELSCAAAFMKTAAEKDAGFFSYFPKAMEYVKDSKNFARAMWRNLSSGAKKSFKNYGRFATRHPVYGIALPSALTGAGAVSYMGGDSANEPIGNVKYRGPTNLDELSNWLKNISSPKNYRNPTNMKELSDWLINYDLK